MIKGLRDMGLSDMKSLVDAIFTITGMHDPQFTSLGYKLQIKNDSIILTMGFKRHTVANKGDVQFNDTDDEYDDE